MSRDPKIAVATHLDPDPDPPPAKSSSSGLLWSSLFADSPSDNAPSSSPTYLANGTPVVIAPPSVILNASTTWVGHLLCRFLGEPPSPAKFFSDLNRIWSKFGNISVHRFSSGIFLVHVPSQSTRKWILETGLWSSGTVSFVVSEWSVNSSLAPPPKLTSAATVITICDIPPQLWSQEGVKTIAGGVGKLIPGTRASLPLSSLGTATIRVIVPLGSHLPSSVLIKDINGDSVLVSINYGRLPYLCSLCSSYGHQPHRCPLKPSATKPIPPKATPKVSKSSDPEPNMVLEHDITALNSPLELPSIQESESVVQGMDVDNTACEIQVLKCSSVPQVSPELMSVPICTSTSLSTQPGSLAELKQHNILSKENSSIQTTLLASTCPTVHIGVAMDADCPSYTVTTLPQLPSQPPLVQPPPSKSSPHLTSQAGSDLQNNFSMETQDIQDPETSFQAMDHTSSSLLQNTQDSEISAQGMESNSKAGDVLVSVGTSSKSQIPDFASPSTNMLQQPTSSSPHQASASAVSATSFSFPPLEVHALNQDSDHLTTSLSPVVTQTTHHTRKRMRAKGTMVENRDHSHDQQVSKVHLKCKLANHKFKPKGVVEKRRKKIQQELWVEAEELEEGIQEMKSDKKNTTHYEAIRAIKILQKSGFGANEDSET